MIPGIKVAWWDVDNFLRLPYASPPQLLEVHLGPLDTTVHRARVVEAFGALAEQYRLVVHQPFVLPNRRPLDLAAQVADERAMSFAIVQAAGELARDIGADALVVHPGGMRSRREADVDPQISLDAFRRLEVPVALLLENMPFWDHTVEGGSGKNTLARSPEGWTAFDEYVAGFCLDTSHAWGARVPGGVGHLLEFLSEPQRILHVHAADSAPPEREGLPLGSGELGGDVFKTIARAVGAEVGCVPEIDGMERDPRVAQEGIRFLSEAGVFDAPSGDT